MNNTFVIGITGGSASGKSTFSGILEKELCNYSLLVFHMDRYFYPEDQLPRSAAPVTGIVYPDFNQPSSVDLSRLKNDFMTAITSGKYQIIIIEGLFALWDPEIYEKLDLKLFIDCKTDERIVRRLRRNMKERGLTFDEISSVYLDLVRYRHDEYVEPCKWRADFILNGSNPFDKAVEVIMSYIILKFNS